MNHSRKKILLATVVAGAMVAIAVAFLYSRHNPPRLAVSPGAISSKADAAAQSGEQLGQMLQKAAYNPAGVESPYESMAFDEIKQYADRGVALAQRRVGQIYDYCFAHNLNSAVHLATLDHFADSNPDSKKAIQTIKKKQAALCSTVDGGDFIPGEASKLWHEAAARNGDVASKVKLKARSTDQISSQELATLTDAVVASDDPQALFEMHGLMSKSASGEIPESLARVSGTPYAGYAWGIVACRAGAAACARGSEAMDSLCINTGGGGCNYANYEDFVMHGIVPMGDRKRILKIIKSIEDMRRQ